MITRVILVDASMQNKIFEMQFIVIEAIVANILSKYGLY